MKPFQIILDGNNTNTFARPSPDYVEAVVLAATTNQAIPIPAAAKDGFVVFSATGNFFAKSGTSSGTAVAAVPGSTTTDGTASELNPSIWSTQDITHIGIIASAITTITLSFYARR